MNERNYIIILYDYYGCLISDKQKSCFEAYYFDNLTLSEISENEDVSRNAIHKMLKNIEKKLLWYEDNLHLCTKEKKIKAILEKSNDDILKSEIEKLF